MGSLNSPRTCFFYYNFSPPVFRSAGSPPPGRLRGSRGINPPNPILIGLFDK